MPVLQAPSGGIPPCAPLQPVEHVTLVKLYTRGGGGISQFKDKIRVASILVAVVVEEDGIVVN